MNQNNRQDFSLKIKKGLKEKINGHYKPGQWLKLSHRNRFSYLNLTVFIFTVVLTFLNSAWLLGGQSIAYNALGEETNEKLILAQEETERRREEGEVRRKESAREEEGEVRRKESAREEEGEVRRKESAREEEGEGGRKESAREEKELPFEEEKKFLEEEIDETYEEWESQKISSEISHSLSASTTILMTVVLTFLGTGLVAIPYRRLVVAILGIITVLIQLNINVFVLEKSLAGYEILAQQGLTLKNKLESAETHEELTEVREQFQELTLESLTIE